MLKTNNKFNLIWLDEINSTNSFVLKNIEKLKNKTIVASLNQTAGRGTKKRKFHSINGKTLAFSILIKNIPTKNLQIIPVFAAVILIFTLNDLKIENCVIKWFNDILLNNKKIAGILVESSILNKNANVVVGIGINLTATKEDFLNLKHLNATSIFLETKKLISAKTFLNEFIKNFDKNFNLLLFNKKDVNFNFLRKLYEKNCISFNKNLKFLNVKTGNIFFGKAIKLLLNGKLLIKKSNQFFSINPFDFSIVN